MKKKKAPARKPAAGITLESFINEKTDARVLIPCGVKDVRKLMSVYEAAPELLEACQALSAAYEAAEESGSIEWEMIDSAYESVLHALEKAGVK